MTRGLRKLAMKPLARPHKHVRSIVRISAATWATALVAVIGLSSCGSGDTDGGAAGEDGPGQGFADLGQALLEGFDLIVGDADQGLGPSGHLVTL